MKQSCRVAAVIVVLLCLGPLAAAADRDGNWWNSLDQQSKLMYVAGIFDGQAYSQMVYTGALLHAMADPRTGKFDADRATVAKQASVLATERLSRDLNNVTAGQLAGGLDKTYGDYRNLRIPATDALIVVIRSINGASDEEVTKLLETKRKAAAR